MLRITQSTNAASASVYYTEGLKREDYYHLGKEVEGCWHGKLLEKLDLEPGNSESKKQFVALLNNKHPVTGKKLSPRMNAEDKRTPGWDFTYSLPKSFSILHAITRDPNIIRVFREAVAETMAEVEKRIQTRVRIDGQHDDRFTGNMAWCEFLHSTSRPLEDGVPDPHLHIHAYVFNITHDSVEDRFKAAKIRDIKDNGFFHEAYFDSVLSAKMEQIGYPIERTSKGWEAAGLTDRNLIEKFSRRTVEIDKLAKNLGITEAKEKDKLGAKSRNKKNKALDDDSLSKIWKARLTGEEAAAIHKIYASRNTPARALKSSAAQAMDFAEAKLFQRESVVPRNRIVAAALKFGVGSVTLDDVTREMQRRRFIEREIDGETKVTTPALVVEEAMMIQRVRDSRGTSAPLLKGALDFINKSLSDEQREAVRHILKSNDRIIALRGIAGAGKTTALVEVRKQLESEGVRIIGLAPSGTASRGVLRDDGFQGATTIAEFLKSKSLQQKSRGHVILVDEAGTVGNRDFERLREIAGSHTRILLSGDTGQHAPVSRGDCLRLLETYAGLPVATVRQIQRQQVKGYKAAVEAMAERDLKTAFARLDEIHAINEIPDDATRYRRVALHYGQCLTETGIAPLVVSPTHAEARMAVAAIRDHLKELGRLGAERNFTQLRELKWEDVERQRPENFAAGQMVAFHQNVPGIKRGSILPVLGVDSSKNVWVESPAGKRISLDLSRAEHFRVFEVDKIALAIGDSIKITNGGKDLNGRRLENGVLSTVKSFGKDGRVTLANGLLLDPNFGHWTHGYETSHSAQGKTARETLVVQSSRSFRAGSLEQFYVSISRGKHVLRIYTDDRTKLQSAVGNSARRLSALEFTGLGDELFLMNGGLSGKQWTERIAQSKAWRSGQVITHVDKLMAQRKIDPPQGKIESHVAFVEMQRANKTSDGKSRSKGHPSASNSKRRGQKGMVVDPRGNQKSEKIATPSKEPEATPKREPVATPKREPEKAALKSINQKQGKPEQKKDSRIKHVEKAVKTSAKHLSEVLARTKRGAETIKDGAKRTINFGGVKTTLGKLANNPATREAQVKKQATKKPPAPKPKPPTPAIRRGR